MPIPLLPAVIAAFTLANGAYYWHQQDALQQIQTKPFKNEKERVQAFKSELADSVFTAYWSKQDKKALLEDPHFLMLGKNQENKYNVKFNTSLEKTYRLGLPANSPIHTAPNRNALKKECGNIRFILGHEGAHIAQGLDENLTIILFINDGIFSEISCMKKNSTFWPYRIILPESKVVPLSSWTLSKNNEFIDALNKRDKAVQEYNALMSESWGLSSYFYSKDKLTALRKQVYEKLIAVSESCSKISCMIEADADKHSLEAIKHAENLSSSEKLRAFLDAKQYFKRDVKNLSTNSIPTHPKNSERIAMIEPYIRDTRMDIIDETVREEIAWQ